MKIKINKDGHKLSFVTKSDLIDIKSLLREISTKGQSVWFWVADQLGRGMYKDAIIGDHYLDAGASYALDGINRSRGEIWASGKSENYINNCIKESDYLFIISGSPLRSKMFNKRVFGLFEKRVGNFKNFKKDILRVSKISSLNELLDSANSFYELRSNPKRKELLNTINDQRVKNTPLKDLLTDYNAFIDYDGLRDGFYADNDFKQNDIMLVLKPAKAGGLSSHSTYVNSIMGSVVGVPDRLINAYDLMINGKEGLGLPQQSQVVAPYGSAVRKIKFGL